MLPRVTGGLPLPSWVARARSGRPLRNPMTPSFKIASDGHAMLKARAQDPWAWRSLVQLEPPAPTAASPAGLQAPCQGRPVEAEHDLPAAMPEVIVEKRGRLVGVSEQEPPAPWGTGHVHLRQQCPVGTEESYCPRPGDGRSGREWLATSDGCRCRHDRASLRPPGGGTLSGPSVTSRSAAHAGASVPKAQSRSSYLKNAVSPWRSPFRSRAIHRAKRAPQRRAVMLGLFGGRSIWLSVTRHGGHR
jgi:hypothetical protein